MNNPDLTNLQKLIAGPPGPPGPGGDAVRNLNKVYYVDGTYGGTSTGSIGAPFASIQAAISAATTAGLTSCQIYVARGVYAAGFTSPAGMAVQIEAMASDNIDDFVGPTASAQSPVRLQGAITHANTAANSSLVISKCSIEVDITYTGTYAAMLHLRSSPMRLNSVVNGNGTTPASYLIECSAPLSTQIGGYETRGDCYFYNVVVIANLAHKYDCGRYVATNTNFGIGSPSNFPVLNTYSDTSQFQLCGFRGNTVFNGAFKSYVWYFDSRSRWAFHQSGTVTYTTNNTTYGPVLKTIGDTEGIEEYLAWGSGGAPFSATAGALTLAYRGGSSFIGSYPVLLNQNTTVTLSPLPQFTQWIKIRFIQDATGGRTLTFANAIRWRDGSVGKIDGRANAESVFWVLVNTLNNGTTTLEDAHIAPIVSITNAAPALWDGTKPTITGSRGGNAALASLLTGLASLGLITDSTS